MGSWYRGGGQCVGMVSDVLMRDGGAGEAGRGGPGRRRGYRARAD